MANNATPIGKSDEQVQDIVAALLSEQGNISLNYDDANDQLTIDTSALNEEQVEDAVAALITGDSNVGVAYDDANDALTLSLSGPVTGVQIGSQSNPVTGYFDSANITGELGIPQYSDPSSGQSNTSEGEIFYAQSDNSLYLNDGA